MFPSRQEQPAPVKESLDVRIPASSPTHGNSNSCSGASMSTDCKDLPEKEDTPQDKRKRHGRVPLTHSEQQLDLQLHVSTDRPALPARRHKRPAQPNLRKSLAWNNAFFTEEGVLDPEELSIVNKTFRKPPDLPKQNLFKKPMTTRIVEPSLGVNANSVLSHLEKSMFTVHPQEVESRLRQGQQRSSSTISSPGSSSGSFTWTGSEKLQLLCKKEKVVLQSLQVLLEPPTQHNTNIKVVGTAEAGSPTSKSVLPKNNMDVGSYQGTQPALPSSFGANNSREKNLEESTTVSAKQLKGAPSKDFSPSSISNFTRKVSSVSKKMKDKLGKIMPGHANVHRGAALVAQDDSRISTSSSNFLRPDSLKSAKLARCYSYTPFERFGRGKSDASLKHMGSHECPVHEIKKSSPELRGENISFVTSVAFSSLDRDSAGSAPADLKARLLSHGKSTADVSCLTLHSQSQVMSNKGHLLQGSVSIGAGSSSLQFPSRQGKVPVIDCAAYRVKPSGLRMPSPKLGFFDPARATAAPQLPPLLPVGNVGGHSGRSVFSSRLASEEASATNSTQQDIIFKHLDISSCRLIQQTCETSGLPIQVAFMTSNIPSVSHLHHPEREHGAPTASSAPPPGIYTDHLSCKAHAEIDAQSSLLRKTDYVNRPFSTKDVTSGKLNVQTFTLEDRRVNQRTSMESSDSQKTDRQQSLVVLGGMSTMGNHQPSLCSDTEGSSALSASAGTQSSVEHTPDPNSHSLIAKYTNETESVLEIEIGSHLNESSSYGTVVNGEYSTQEAALERSPETTLQEHKIYQVNAGAASNFGHSRENIQNDSREDMNMTDPSLKLLSQMVSQPASTLTTCKPSTQLLPKKVAVAVDNSSSSSDWPAIEVNPPDAQAMLQKTRPSFPLCLSAQNSKIIKVDKNSNIDPPVPIHANLNRSNEGSPLIMNGGNFVNGNGKEKGSIFAFAKKAVSRISTSPSSGDASGSKNGLTGQLGGITLRKMKQNKLVRSHSQNIADNDEFQKISNLSPFSEERISALEAAGQEWFQMKSGAVQNSPPDKISPERGPWSPVRRNGQELGPFDCTKCLNTGLNGGVAQ